MKSNKAYFPLQVVAQTLLVHASFKKKSRFVFLCQQKGANVGNHGGSTSYFYVLLAITEGSLASETMRRPKLFVE